MDSSPRHPADSPDAPGPRNIDIWDPMDTGNDTENTIVSTSTEQHVIPSIEDHEDGVTSQGQEPRNNQELGNSVGSGTVGPIRGPRGSMSSRASPYGRGQGSGGRPSPAPSGRSDSVGPAETPGTGTNNTNPSREYRTIQCGPGLPIRPISSAQRRSAASLFPAYTPNNGTNNANPPPAVQSLPFMTTTQPAGMGSLVPAHTPNNGTNNANPPPAVQPPAAQPLPFMTAIQPAGMGSLVPAYTPNNSTNNANPPPAVQPPPGIQPQTLTTANNTGNASGPTSTNVPAHRPFLPAAVFIRLPPQMRLLFCTLPMNRIIALPPLGPPFGIVCVACGGICIHHNSKDNEPVTRMSFPEWMIPTLLRAKPTYEEWRNMSSASRVSRDPESQDVNLLEHLEVTKFISIPRGMDVEGEDGLHVNTSEALMNIPIHNTCREVAKLFCRNQARYDVDFRSPDGGAPASLAHLYEIWCKRAIATHPSGRMWQPIMEPHDYFGAPNSESEYLRGVNVEARRLFTACPVDIEGLTDKVVNTLLQTMDGKDTQIRGDLKEIWARVEKLPEELYNWVVDSLEPFERPALTPSRVLPSSWWKKKLLSGQLIPWLWDLKEQDIVEYRVREFYRHQTRAEALADLENGAYVFDEDMWDWELLCRQLTQWDIEADGTIENRYGSYQLCNRRRIWKLLDKSRLGHLKLA